MGLFHFDVVARIVVVVALVITVRTLSSWHVLLLFFASVKVIGNVQIVFPSGLPVCSSCHYACGLHGLRLSQGP